MRMRRWPTHDQFRIRSCQSPLHRGLDLELHLSSGGWYIYIYMALSPERWRGIYPIATTVHVGGSSLPEENLQACVPS